MARNNLLDGEDPIAGEEYNPIGGENLFLGEDNNLFGREEPVLGEEYPSRQHMYAFSREHVYGF